MSTAGDLELPEELLEVLPTDPFEQLDVARKITSMAVAARVSKLEAETGKLRQKLGEKDNTIYNLQQHIMEIEQSLQDTTTRLSHALDEQAKLTNEKNILVATVKKLNRDVAKLETFKRTLMQSLQEDEEAGPKREDSEKTSRFSSIDSTLSSGNSLRETDFASSRLETVDDGSGTASGRSNQQARFWSMKSASDRETPSTAQEDEHHPDIDANPGSQEAHSLTPHQLTRQLTPTGSPKRQSVIGSAPASPRWHSITDARLPLPSSQSASQHTTAPNSPPAGSLPTRTPRVDGKEFFRQARNRLSFKQFSAFLANIKELNAHRQTREETLKNADEIFGPENKDLYVAFDGLLSRHVPS